MKREELRLLLAICMSGVIPSVAGCGAAPDSPSQENPPGATSKTEPRRRTASSGPLLDTSISVDADGQVSVSTREVTPEYREIQSKYRDKQLVAKLQREMLYKEEPGKLASADQVSCDNPDAMWLNTDIEQGGDRICFYSFDVAMPNGIPSGFANNIRSWWSGTEWGALHDDAHPWGGNCDYLCPFDANQREDYADYLAPECGLRANQLNQNAYCFLNK